MDPAVLSALVAFASEAGTETARQAWAGLKALVARRFGRADPEVSGAVDRLEADPGGGPDAQLVAAALLSRAETDPGFRAELETWFEHTRPYVDRSGEVHNSVGGQVTGKVVQGRDFNGPVSL